MKKKSSPAKGRGRGRKDSPAPVSMEKSQMQYQTEEDVRTLMRAEEIRQNKGRLNRAVNEAKKQATRVLRIAKP